MVGRPRAISTDDLARTEPYADLHHIDVADGRFAPAFLFFPDLVARIAGADRAADPCPSDGRPTRSSRRRSAQFAEAGADLISVHAENGEAADGAGRSLAELGAAAGVVLRLETPVDGRRRPSWPRRLRDAARHRIGVKGQGLSDAGLPAAAAEARALLREAGARGRVVLAADGGIRDETVPRLRAPAPTPWSWARSPSATPTSPARMRWLHALPVRPGGLTERPCAALAVDLGGTELRAPSSTRPAGSSPSPPRPTRGDDGPRRRSSSRSRPLVERIRAAARPTSRSLGLGVGAPGPLDPGRRHRASARRRWPAGTTCRCATCCGSGSACRSGWRTTPTPPRWASGASAPARGARSLVFVTVSTGIGGGVIVDGRLLHGRRGMAAEIGHMTITDAGRALLLRRVGCFEALASGSALGRRAAAAAARRRRPALRAPRRRRASRAAATSSRPPGGRPLGRWRCWRTRPAGSASASPTSCTSTRPR